ncbi:MAG: ornithine cyclodeaminase family protein [Halobacteria archaeon]|nr:ornithine cyclodeaminase family protein [Halobacteria archaeon]
MVRVLSDKDIQGLLDLNDLLGVVEDAFVKQGRDEVERPERPHFDVGTGLDPDNRAEPQGMGLVMPAYIHGAEHYATKIVSVHEKNKKKDLPTVNAQIALVNADNGLPSAYMAGTRITNARTGCIGGLSARELAHEPVKLGVIGAGTQARWQSRAIATATNVEEIRVYSPSDSKYECAEDLKSLLDVSATAVSTPREAVEGANVVVTATTATEPVFPGDALSDDTLVVAVGAYTAEMQEIDLTTVERAARIFADVPEEVRGIGDIKNTIPDVELIPLSEVFEGNAGRETEDEIIVVDSVGTAVLDAATSEHLLGKAEEEGVGSDVEI